MSSQNALQLATAIQSKVGSSLISVQNLLPPAESASANLQAGAGSMGVFLLRDIYDMQARTYESVNNVGSILKSQLDLAEDAERRARDQAAELEKENQGSGVPGPTTGDGEGTGEEEGSGFDIGTILTAGLGTAMLSKEALKNFGKKLGGKLLRGGIYGAIAGYVADPITNYVTKEFNLELDQTAKDEIKFGMIGAGVGFGVAGIPGAIIGATVPMIAKVASYIGGSLNADEIRDSDFAMAGIGTAAAGMFTASKLGAVFAGSTIPKVATFGAALGSLPVLIGIGAAVAVGAGAMFIAKKVDEYQEMALKKLGETTMKLDREMGEWAAREEEGLFERFGINLGKLSALGEASVAASEASEQLGQNKEKFIADTATQSKLVALADTMLNYSDDALKTILTDSTKATNFFDTVENLKNIAAKGGFGDQSQAVFEKLSAFSDRIQNYATKLVEQGVTGGKVRAAAENMAGIGGDQLEKVGELQAQKEGLQKELQVQKDQLAIEEKKLQEMKDAGMKGDMNIFSKNEFEQQEAVIKKLNQEIAGVGGLENKIKMLDKSIEKFGSTNGFLFNMEDLRQLYSDDPEGLKALIERSVTQQGTSFLNEQKQANENANAPGVVYTDQSVKQSSQSNFAKTDIHAGKLNTSSDYHFDRDAYAYGAI
jgi:hypothetical protein